MPTQTTAEWRTIVQDTLVGTYVKQRGDTPKGTFDPSPAIVTALLEKFNGEPETAIIKFLRDSMFAHMLKTQRTHTPFYIQNLLSKASLAYLEKKQSWIREFYLQNIEPIQFSNNVIGEVLASEMDFLEVIGGSWMKGNRTIDWGLLEPGIHWVIFSQMFKRFDHKVVSLWDDVMVEYDASYIPMGQARVLERKSLGDAHRYETCRAAFEVALRDAAVAWSRSLGLLHTRVDENKETVIISNDQNVPADLLDCCSDLSRRDVKLFDWVRERLVVRAQTPSAGRLSQIAAYLIETCRHAELQDTTVGHMDPLAAGQKFAGVDDR